MHKHFRMLAISEHLRSHGYDPAVYTHIRIPGIWKKLSEFFNMPVIDERENSMDYAEDPNYDERFKPFDLPWQEYGEAIMQRAVADPSEAPTSPPQIDKSPIISKKRKRGDAVGHPKTRSSTVDDSEADNDADAEEAQPNPARKSARSARSAKRAASKAKAESPEAEDNAEDEEDEESEEEDESEEEEETPATKSSRGGRSWRRGRARARGRGRRG